LVIKAKHDMIMIMIIVKKFNNQIIFHVALETMNEA